MQLRAYSPKRSSQRECSSTLGRSLLLQRKCACGVMSGAGGECEECKKREEQTLQRWAVSPAGTRTAPPIVHEVLRSPGQPLDGKTRAYMEPRFGHDFAHVRVHQDGRAADSARSVKALAYTVGEHVVFGVGRYDPEGATGRRLLAHELVHVVQQTGSAQAPIPASGLPLGEPGDCFESEAEARAESTFGAYPAPASPRRSAPRLSGAWESCGDSPDCPDREPGERDRGATPSFSVGELLSPESGEIVFGFAIGSSAVSALARDATWTAFAANVASSDDHWEILGFSDCGGTIELNQTLRSQRAAAMRGLLPSGGEAKIDRAAGAPLSDCVGDNSTEQNRGFNRSVVFRRIAQSIVFPDETIKGGPNPSAGNTEPVQRECAKTPGCPDDFCLPFPTTKEAIASRDQNIDRIVDRITGLNAKCGPLYREYLLGGTKDLRDLSASLGDEFRRTGPVLNASKFLADALNKALNANPPNFPPGVDRVILPVRGLLSQSDLDVVNTPGGPHTLEFVFPGDGAAGLLAGGIGEGEADCRVGAKPSDFPDKRSVAGTVDVFRNPDGSLLITPAFTFTVIDTIDFCPGNCGGLAAQLFGFTVLMSRYEANNIAGDLPFKVEFDGPSLVGAFDSEE
jgi:hypothetical protein